jgi:hypothetical protein
MCALSDEDGHQTATERPSSIAKKKILAGFITSQHSGPMSFCAGNESSRSFQLVHHRVSFLGCSHNQPWQTVTNGDNHWSTIWTGMFRNCMYVLHSCTVPYSRKPVGGDRMRDRGHFKKFWYIFYEQVLHVVLFLLSPWPLWFLCVWLCFLRPACGMCVGGQEFAAISPGLSWQHPLAGSTSVLDFTVFSQWGIFQSFLSKQAHFLCIRPMLHKIWH